MCSGLFCSLRCYIWQFGFCGLVWLLDLLFTVARFGVGLLVNAYGFVVWVCFVVMWLICVLCCCPLGSAI